MTFSYRPYILVSAQLDSDISRRDNGKESDEQALPLRHTIRDFAEHCRGWDRRHEDMYKAWRAGLPKERCIKLEEKEKEEKNDLFKWLNKPVCYLPISGHSDGFGLVAFDSLDASNYLGSVSAKTVEDLTVLLAPDMDTIRENVAKRLPYAPSDLIDTLKNVDALFQGADFGPNDRGGEVRVPEAIEKRPLLAYSRCKLEGMLALDLSGWLVDAILPSLGVCLVQKLVKMRNEYLADSERMGRLYKDVDLKACAITLLHSQGTNELCVLIHGTNLTVAAALLSTVREMSLDKVTDDEFDGVSYLRKWLQEGHDGNFTLPGKQQGDANDKDPKWDWEIGDCFRVFGRLGKLGVKDTGKLPVFRWTLTSTCMVSDGMAPKEAEWSVVGGWLRLHAFLQITPAGKGMDINGSTSCQMKSALPEEGDYRLHLQGLFDVLHTLECEGAKNSKDESKAALVSASDAVKWLIEKYRDLGSSKHPNFVGLQSMVSIPVPVALAHRGKTANNSPEAQSDSWGVRGVLAEARKEFMSKVGGLQNILNEIQECENCEDGSKQPKEYDWYFLLANHTKGGRGGIYQLLRTQFLEIIPKLYGLPAALQESVACLFHQYICAVTNPHLFDLVADLLDAFATLHHVLCQIFPRDLWRRKNLGLTKPLNPEIAQRMAHYVSALHHALDHRIQRAYPDSPLRDMAVDLRGDVYGFIQMAEAPLKCGVGLVANENSFWALNESHRRRDLLGVFTQVGVTAGIKAVYQNLGVEKRARLAYFASDVPHLMLVGSCVDYLHEASHVAFETLISHHEDIRRYFLKKFNEQSWSEAKKIERLANIETLLKLAEMPETESALVAKKRLSELFVHSLTYKLLCPAEQSLFLRFFVSRFSAAPENAGYPLVQTIHRFAELFSVLYLGSYCLRKDGEGQWTTQKVTDFFIPSESGLPKEEEEMNFDSVLLEMLTWYGPYEHLQTEREKEAVREFIKTYFKAFMRQMLSPKEGPDINEILDLALFAFVGYAEKIVSDVKKTEASDIEIARSYSKIRKNYFWSKVGSEEHLRGVLHKVQAGQSIYSYFTKKGEDGGSELRTINPMLMCGMLLRAYLHDLSEKEQPKDKEKRGRVNVFDIQQPLGHGIDRKVHHHDYVMYHGNASRTFIAPHQRRDRLRKQIAVMRSFWNLAAVIKGRRFCDLLRFADLLEVPPK